ncbi:IS630 family transposase [Gemmata massiliana]|nr:IS630 family transposase [Gemmata massiliana]
MSQKKYVVTLSADERDHLDDLLRTGKVSVLVRTQTRILLRADQADGGPALDDETIADQLEVGLRTISRVRRRFVERGFEDCVRRKKQDRPSRVCKLDGAAEARLIAVACSTPPDGREAWTMQMLADKLIALDVVEAIFDETVRRALKKGALKPWLKEQWCIPDGPRGEFVARMEDVIEVYQRPYDPKRPQVCIDEQPVQLIGETRIPLPARPGRSRRFDYEYRRNGTANLFLAFAPLVGWRHVEVTERRTAQDFGMFLRYVVDEVYAEAHRVVLITDNLNVHGPGSLYEALDPTTARRVAEKIEWHYTPKHGSWLNVAECEFAVLTRQCLSRRIESVEELRRQVEAWENARNDRLVEAQWRVTTADARIKLRRLYPSTQ